MFNLVNHQTEKNPIIIVKQNSILTGHVLHDISKLALYL